MLMRRTQNIAHRRIVVRRGVSVVTNLSAIRQRRDMLCLCPRPDCGRFALPAFWTTFAGDIAVKSVSKSASNHRLTIQRGLSCGPNTGGIANANRKRISTNYVAPQLQTTRWNTSMTPEDRKNVADTVARHEKLKFDEMSEFTNQIRNGYNEFALGSLPKNIVDKIERTITYWSFKTFRSAADNAECLFERLVLERKHGNDSVVLSSYKYNKVISGWVRSIRRTGDSDRIERAEQLFDRMERRALSKVDEGGPFPNTVTYNILLCVYSRTNDVEKMEQMLSWMENDKQCAPPDASTYNALLRCFSKQGTEEGARRGEEMLIRMAENRSTRPNIVSFCLVMEGWMSCSSAIGFSRAAQYCEALLQCLLQLRDNGHEQLMPTLWVFNLVIEALSKCQGKDAFERSQKIFCIMRQEVANGNRHAKPSRRTYDSFLETIAKSGLPTAGDLAERVLKKMKSKAETQPVVFSYALVVDAWARTDSKNENAALEAERVLNDLLQWRKNASEVDDFCLGYAFNAAIMAWARRGNGPRASQILDLMEKTEGVIPHTRAFLHVIDAWLYRRNTRGPFEAFKVLNRMESAVLQGNLNAKPDSFCYNKVIGALVREGNLNEMEIAHQLWTSEAKSHIQKDPTIHLGARMSNAVLGGWLKCPHRKSVDRVGHILKFMEDQSKGGKITFEWDRLSFILAARAVAKFGNRDVHMRLAHLLNKAHEAEARIGRPIVDIVFYNTVINAYVDSKDIRRAEHAHRLLLWLEKQDSDNNDVSKKPDVCTYNWVIKAFTSSGDCENADLLLERMEESALGGLSGMIAPDHFTYLLLISGWGQRNQSIIGVSRAQSILTRFMKLSRESKISATPSELHFNALIRAWGKSGSAEAGRRADELLTMMQNAYLGGAQQLKPSRRTYCDVIYAWTNSGEPTSNETAESVLWMMEAEHRQGNADIYAETFAFNTAIKGWARSTDDQKVRRAFSLLKKIIETKERTKSEIVRPDCDTYNQVLHACSFAKDSKTAKEEALCLAHETFDLFLKDKQVEPNNISYETMLQIVKDFTHDTEERNKRMLKLFRRCQMEKRDSPKVRNLMHDTFPSFNSTESNHGTGCVA